MNKSEIIALTVAATLVAGCFLSSLFISEESSIDAPLRAAVECTREGRLSGSLTTGYCYHLLKRFAEDMDKELEIVLREKDCTDSLGSGTFDIIATTRPLPDSIAVSIIISDGSPASFNVKTGDVTLHRELEGWMRRYRSSKDFTRERDSFLRNFNPVLKAEAGGRTATLSPYDNLIRTYADTIGCDWKFLAAVIFKESQFRMEARSPRGAEGLMQMMPQTAAKWCDGDISEPEQGIKAGALYLKSLSRRYRGVSANDVERMKFTLAAYNAGEGRIRDVINYARFRNVETGYWDSVITVIPEMRDTQRMAVTDTVKLGVFKGLETMDYVSSVMDLYDAYNKIYIEK